MPGSLVSFLRFGAVLWFAAWLPFPSCRAAQPAPKPSAGASPSARTIRAIGAELTPEDMVRPARQTTADPDDTDVEESEAERPKWSRSRTFGPSSAFVRDALSPGTEGHPPGPPPPAPTPAPLVGPFPGQSLGSDPQVAAGDDYVAVIEAHHLSFYDKTGVPLIDPSTSKPFSLGSEQLFQRFLNPLNKDGSVNQRNVNLQAGFPVGAPEPCVLTDPSAQGGCVDEVFDLRVIYDTKHKRFVFVGTARNQIWSCDDYGDTDCKPAHSDPGLCSTKTCREAVAKLVRRYTMFAITKDEDPRHGFNTYWFPTGGDWPMAAVNGSRLIITVNDICTDHVVACPPVNTYPLIYVVSTDDIAANSSSPAVNWYTANVGIPYTRGLKPVESQDGTGPDYVMAPSGGSLHVWAMTDPSKPLADATIDVQETGMIRGKAVLQSGKIYYAYQSGAWCPSLKPVPADCPLKVRLLAIVPSLSAKGKLSLAFAKLPNGKTFDVSFGHNGPGDDPSDLVSYELPSLEVTKNGDVVVAYVRRGTKTAKPLFNEARYSVIYHGENQVRPSAVLKLGEGAATKVPYNAGLDLAVESLDPADKQTVWITHAYAKAGGAYGMEWAAVRP